MKPELILLARYFGNRLARLPEGAAPIGEFMAIVEHRVSEITGIPWSSPRYHDEVDPVAQMVLEIAERGSPEPADPRPPTEEEYGTMPVKGWLVTAYDHRDRPTKNALVQGRTAEEAMRHAKASAPPGTWALSATGTGQLEGTA
jgi:hypothetical protein